MQVTPLGGILTTEVGGDVGRTLSYLNTVLRQANTPRVSLKRLSPSQKVFLGLEGLESQRFFSDVRSLPQTLETAEKNGLLRIVDNQVQLLPLSPDQLPETVIHVFNFYKLATRIDPKFFFSDPSALTDFLTISLSDDKMVIRNHFTEMSLFISELGSPTWQTYFAAWEVLDDVVIHSNVAHDELPLSRVAENFMYAMLEVNPRILSTPVYIDPEQFMGQFYRKEFGGTFLTVGEIPVSVLRGLVQGDQLGFPDGKYRQRGPSLLENPPSLGYISWD